MAKALMICTIIAGKEVLVVVKGDGAMDAMQKFIFEFSQSFSLRKPDGTVRKMKFGGNGNIRFIRFQLWEGVGELKSLLTNFIQRWPTVKLCTTF